MFNQSPKKIVQMNRLPFVLGVLVLLIVMGVFLYRSQAKRKIAITADKPSQSIDVSPKAVDASWFNDEKFKNMKLNTESTLHTPTPKEIEVKLASAQEIDLKKQEIEDDYATQLEIKKMQDKEKIDEAKLEINAQRSPLAVDAPPAPGTKEEKPVKAESKDLITSGIDQLMNMAKSATGSKIPALSVMGSALGSSGLGADLNNQNAKKDFLKKTDTDDDYLEAVKTKPRSAYEVKAGSYISAALITGINSDLPGNVNAQVTQNVYDSVTGNYLLIPQGAKLVGEYNSNLSFGQQRVQVVWDRIIFPDGTSLDIQKMQGGDISGFTGFHDKVDNHYLRIYGNAVLLSLMGAGYNILNQNAQQTTDPRASVAASVGQKLADVSEQALQKNMDVQPTLIINPGYKFKIFVMKDMVLENIDNAQGTLSYSK